MIVLIDNIIKRYQTAEQFCKQAAFIFTYSWGSAQTLRQF